MGFRPAGSPHRGTNELGGALRGGGVEAREDAPRRRQLDLPGSRLSRRCLRETSQSSVWKAKTVTSPTPATQFMANAPRLATWLASQPATPAVGCVVVVGAVAMVGPGDGRVINPAGCIGCAAWRHEGHCRRDGNRENLGKPGQPVDTAISFVS